MSRTASHTSTVPEPLTADGHSTALYGVLKQLEVSQWWGAAQLEQGVLPQLRRLLRHARDYSPYYGQRLRNVDIDAIDRARFAEIPVLTRAQLQAANRTIDATPLPPDHGEPEECMTSGSTATPVRIRGTGVTALLWQAITLREHLWHQRAVAGTACAIRWRGDNIGLSAEGVALPDWGAPINQFFRTGPSYFLNSAVDIAKQKQWLERRQPTYLMSHPSNVAALAHAFHRDSSRLPALQEVRTVGETVSPALRASVRANLGVGITDFYSSQELGYIALQCPAHEHYHVQAESVLVEVLREDGSPCDPYESGRLVVTSLRNYATPLIRYEVGDYGALGEPCACGRGLPVLHAINGRVRNMLLLPDGNRRWPNFGFGKMMAIAELRQFQVVQTGRDTIELKVVVADSPLGPAQEAQLRQVLCDSLGYPFTVSISYHAALPSGAGGKFDDFVSLVSADQ